MRRKRMHGHRRRRSPILLSDADAADQLRDEFASDTDGMSIGERSDFTKNSSEYFTKDSPQYKAASEQGGGGFQEAEAANATAATEGGEAKKPFDPWAKNDASTEAKPGAESERPKMTFW